MQGEQSDPDTQPNSHEISGDNAWSLLEAELDQWVVAGKTAKLWWRDDDAVTTGPQLDQLIEICTDVGLLLAVIPAHAQAPLAARVAQVNHVHIAQHGYAHINHAPRGQGLGAWELGLHRGQAAVLADLQVGRERLDHLFGPRFMPIIVPPWNHIDSALFAPIAAAGYRGISAFGPRQSDSSATELIRVNAHCDPIRWKSGARFRGVEKTVNQLVEHLMAKRSGRVDANEPTGFLTHHKDLDAAGWDFCVKLVEIVTSHSGACWISPLAAFESTP